VVRCNVLQCVVMSCRCCIVLQNVAARWWSWSWAHSRGTGGEGLFPQVVSPKTQKKMGTRRPLKRNAFLDHFSFFFSFFPSLFFCFPSPFFCFPSFYIVFWGGETLVGQPPCGKAMLVTIETKKIECKRQLLNRCMK